MARAPFVQEFVITIPAREALGTMAARPERRCRIELRLDLEGLAYQLGSKARRNSSNKAHEAGGLVEARYLGDVPTAPRVRCGFTERAKTHDGTHEATRVCVLEPDHTGDHRFTGWTIADEPSGGGHA